MPEAVAAWAGRTPDAVALSDHGGRSLTYAELVACVQDIASGLAGAGIARNDRIVVALPFGAMNAVATLGVMGAATVVPIEPDARPTEVEWLLRESRARGILVARGSRGAGRAVAERLGLPVFEVVAEPDRGPGACRVARVRGREAPRRAEAGDVAFILRTSGTTGRPKLVPRTHGATLRVLDGFRAWHGLGPGDRSMVMGPMTHNSTLHTGVLAPLVVGGSVAIPPGLAPEDILGAWRSSSPTYGSLVPVRLSRVLALLRDDPSHARPTSLRFLRCSAAELAPGAWREAECALGVPVLPSWGMTEVGSCVLSNPLARDAAKPGTVGLPVHSGVEVAILDEAGQRLGDGMEGELAVRGPIVMRGYLGEPSGDRADGWFRTGDIAVRDGDGFYAIRGRIKEMINCGGGKIHPSEIDAVAAESPGVAEAASFADPHPTLGETPALAVVPAMADVDLDGLRRHIAGVLGIEKAPRRIVAVEAIPRTVSGKVDRSALARLPRCEGRSEPEPAGSVGATGLEEPIAALWRVVLARPDIPLDRDFFELGGDSLGATQLLLGIEAAYGVRLSSEAFLLDAYTVRRMARAVAAGRGIGPAPVLRERAGPDFVEMDPWRRKGIGRIFHIDPASGLRRARPGSAWGSVAINNLGFRGPDVAADKPDGTVRIAFLGSSTTFDRFSGGNDRTWPDGVVRLLAKAFPAAVLDYVNAGMPGHGTRQIGAMFRHHVAPLAPDLVVIRVNDLNADTAFAARRQGRYSGVHYRPSPLAERWRPWANLEKNLLVLVRVATAALDLGKARLDGAALVGAFAARLRALVEEVAATGATVALVVGGNRLRKGLGPWRRLRAASSQVFYMPHLSLADLVDLREAYERAVAEVATESGAILVDVADAIPADSRHFVDSNHFTAAGSARMAQVVSAKLIDAPAVRERVVGAGRRQSPARTA